MSEPYSSLSGSSAIDSTPQPRGDRDTALTPRSRGSGYGGGLTIYGALCIALIFLYIFSFGLVALYKGTVYLGMHAGKEVVLVKKSKPSGSSFNEYLSTIYSPLLLACAFSPAAQEVLNAYLSLWDARLDIIELDRAPNPPAQSASLMLPAQ